MRAAMRRAGIDGAAELARRAQLNPVTVRAYLNETRELSSHRAATAIAGALGVSVEELMGSVELKPARGRASSQSEVRAAFVKGVAAAGAWVEETTLHDISDYCVPVVPGRYAALNQYAFKIVGTSMDAARLFDGDYAICVDYWAARSAPSDGDIVVVERRQGGLTERTCKLIRSIEGGFELWPQSTDPKWQKPIQINRNLEASDGIEIEIVSLVVGRYSPL